MRMAPHQLTAFILLILIGLWMAQGEVRRPFAAALTQAKPTSSQPQVQIIQAQPQAIHPQLTLQAQVEAWRHVQLKAQWSAPVTEIWAKKGQDLASGEAILHLEAQDLPWQLEQARAQLVSARLDLQATQSLAKQAYQAHNQISAHQAQVQAAQAQVARIEQQIQKLTLSAPFDGYLDQLHVEIGDFVDVGQVIADYLDLSQVKLTAYLPQTQQAGIELGTPARVHFNALPTQVFDAQVDWIASEAHPSTHAYAIEVHLPHPQTSARLVGSTASLDLLLPAQTAYWVPRNALSLHEGHLYVHYVDDQQRLERLQAQLVRTQSQGVWVSLPELTQAQSLQLVVLGQHLASLGTQVIPQIANLPAFTPELP
ncbi:membrane fusion protein, multidrug efflux system [Allopseudospirillum japonicum]|uniref:Membrane fusion protein, multidrug efflux system n=1 Tax=Allopseudospirillum japonicum TaxID=64971 RepID=A0A1H6QIW2_9GAMM|nr:efflux RND transporter periplasmic adaptor subunit [Allopseudospirillum japonicum]SEI39410.1 membrane fusion protein, multidrug efflux system [Allopseudospirillum japonicum]